MSAIVAPARPDRLRGSRDVRKVLRTGTRRSSARLTAHVLTTTTDGVRLAVVASRRVGSSPARNRAKRLLREAAARVAWPDAADVVLVARPGIAGARLWDVVEDLSTMTARDW